MTNEELVQDMIYKLESKYGDKQAAHIVSVATQKAMGHYQHGSGKELLFGCVAEELKAYL